MLCLNSHNSTSIVGLNSADSFQQQNIKTNILKRGKVWVSFLCRTIVIYEYVFFFWKSGR